MNLYVADLPKSTSKYFLFISEYILETTYFGGIFVKKPPKSCKTDLGQKINGKISQKYIYSMSLDMFEGLGSSNSFF